MNNRTKVAFVTLSISLIVLFLKTKAYYATFSVGVLSDALETVVNVLTAIIALFAVKIAAEPADENHPYGHGKLEYFSAAFEGGLIFFAALAIVFQGVKSFFITNETLNVFNGNVYLILATAINLLTGAFLVGFGKKENSEALKASGLHLMSDVITTVGVFAGLVLVNWTGLLWIDSLVGIAVGAYLLYEAFKILKSNTDALMDATDLESVKLLSEVINANKNKAVIDVHNLKIIRAGHFHHIDAHLVVPEYLDVATAHDLTGQFEEKVVSAYKYEGEIAFHVDPCNKSYCQQCEMHECQIRVQKFEKAKVYKAEDLVKGPQYTTKGWS
jgi:cation diffusion facilitator family transporter